jgi:hypothetical protein
MCRPGDSGKTLKHLSIVGRISNPAAVDGLEIRPTGTDGLEIRPTAKPARLATSKLLRHRNVRRDPAVSYPTCAGAATGPNIGDK